VHKARRVRKGPRACKGFRELRVKLALKDHTGRRVPRGRRARKAIKVTWELSVPRARRDPPVLQGLPVRLVLRASQLPAAAV
jgi:hypothetical protein